MDERAANRVEVDKLIDVHIDDRTAHALLYNLSISGCMIEASDDRLRSGDEVVLRLDDKLQATGRIVWHYGRCCGIRFDENIHETAIHHLGFQPSDEREDFERPFDRFGRILTPLKG